MRRIVNVGKGKYKICKPISERVITERGISQFLLKRHDFC